MAVGKTKRRRGYGTGSIHQRASDGLWAATVELGTSADGKRRRAYIYAKTYKEAVEKKKAKEAEIASGGRSTLADRTTVKTYSAQWLEQIVTKVRPKTYSTNVSAIRQWIVPTIGNVRLNELNAADIRRVDAAQRAAGRTASTRLRTHAVLVKMLRDATVDGARVHPGVLAVERPRVGETDRSSMPIDGALSILRLVESQPDPSKWVGALLNGVRQGERLGMTRECLDFDNDVINVLWQLQELPYIDNKNKALGFRVPDEFVARQLVGRFHLVRPKTKKGWRTIPMTPWFRAAMLARLETMPDSPHGLVWGDEHGQPVDPHADRREWYELQRRAGVDEHPAGRPYKVHEIRHTTITLLIELGIDKDIIAQIVGQSKLVESYNHANYMPQVRQAMDALAERLQLQAIGVEREAGAAPAALDASLADPA